MEGKFLKLFFYLLSMLVALFVLGFAFSPVRTHFFIKYLQTHPVIPLVVSSGTFVAGENFYIVMEKHGIAPADIVSAIDNLCRHVSPRDLKPGQSYTIARTTDNVLFSFHYFQQE